MPGLAQLAVLRLAIQLSQLQLRLAITGTCSLPQHFETDAPIALAVAVGAEQPPEPTLRFDHALTRGLLEHSTGDSFDTLGLS